jgi:hypothetical protein
MRKKIHREQMLFTLRKILRKVFPRKPGRPKTGMRGRRLNLYVPGDVIADAKAHFNRYERMSLSEAVTRMLRRHLKKGGAL